MTINDLYMNESPDLTTTLTFALVESIFVGKDIEHSPEIELLFDRKKEGYLAACRITIHNSTEEKINLATTKVEFLANYLGIFTGLPVRFNNPSITKYQNGKYLGTRSNSLTINVVKPTDTSLKLSDTLSLQNNHELAQRLAHANKGRKALFNNDFQGAIREYYLAFENSGHPEEKKYLSPRNAVSHQRLDSEKTIIELRNFFGISIRRSGYLDANEPAIRQLLEAHARKLKEVVEEYLKLELSKR